MALSKHAHTGFLYFSSVSLSCILLPVGIVTRLLKYFPDKIVALSSSFFSFSVHASFVVHYSNVGDSSTAGLLGGALSSLSLPLPLPIYSSSLYGDYITGGFCVDAYFVS